MTLLFPQHGETASHFQSQKFELLIFVVGKKIGVKFNEQFNVWTVLMSNAIPDTLHLIPGLPSTDFSIIFGINVLHQWRYFRSQDTGCMQMCPHLCDSYNPGGKLMLGDFNDKMQIPLLIVWRTPNIEITTDNCYGFEICTWCKNFCIKTPTSREFWLSHWKHGVNHPGLAEINAPVGPQEV